MTRLLRAELPLRTFKLSLRREREAKGRSTQCMRYSLRYCSCVNNLFFQLSISARPMKEKRRMQYLLVRGIRRDCTRCLRRTQFDAFTDYFIDMYMETWNIKFNP